MPLVDGDQSTRMIRHYEQELEDLQIIRPRVPIIAVSASLTEDKRFNYVQSGYVCLLQSLFPPIHEFGVRQVVEIVIELTDHVASTAGS